MTDTLPSISDTDWAAYQKARFSRYASSLLETLNFAEHGQRLLDGLRPIAPVRPAVPPAPDVPEDVARRVDAERAPEPAAPADDGSLAGLASTLMGSLTPIDPAADTPNFRLDVPDSFRGYQAQQRRQLAPPDPFGRVDFGPAADTRADLPPAPLTTRAAEETLDTAGFSPDAPGLAARPLADGDPGKPSAFTYAGNRLTDAADALGGSLPGGALRGAANVLGRMGAAADDIRASAAAGDVGGIAGGAWEGAQAGMALPGSVVHAASREVGAPDAVAAPLGLAADLAVPANALDRAAGRVIAPIAGAAGRAVRGGAEDAAADVARRVDEAGGLVPFLERGEARLPTGRRVPLSPAGEARRAEWIAENVNAVMADDLAAYRADEAIRQLADAGRIPAEYLAPGGRAATPPAAPAATTTTATATPAPTPAAVGAEDWFRAVRYSSMLSSPRTFEVNFIGNALGLPWRFGRDAVASTARGRPQELLPEAAGLWAGIARGAHAFVETLAHGITAEAAARGDVPETLAGRLQHPAARGLATALELPGRINQATDEWARAAALGMAVGRRAAVTASKEGLRGRLWDLRVADLMNAPTEAMLREGAQIADRMTMKGDLGNLGGALKGIQRVPALGHLALPFLSTVYHLTSRGVDRSPLGLAGTAWDVARGKYGRDLGAALGGKLPKDAPAALVPLGERLGDNLIGGALATAFFTHQALQGNISGAGPDDRTTRDALRSEGWQPYAIKLGDRWVSYANWGPIAIPLATAAGIGESVTYRQPKDTPLSVVGDAFGRTARLLTEQSYLSGVGAIYRSMAEPDRYGHQWLSQFVQTLIPYGSAINTVGQLTDPVQRRGAKGDIGEALMARFPILRQQLPAQRDYLGQDIPNPYSGAAALLPWRVTQERVSPENRRYLGSGSALMDERIGRAVAAYDNWRRHPDQYREPTQEEIRLALLHGKNENPRYALLRRQELARQRREQLARDRR